MLHRPRGAQGRRREQAPREQGPPPRARRAFQRAGPPGESRPAFGTVGWGPSLPLPCADREAPGPFLWFPPNCWDSYGTGGRGGGWGEQISSSSLFKKGRSRGPKRREGQPEAA